MYKQGTNQHKIKTKGWTMWEKIFLTIIIMGGSCVYLATHRPVSTDGHVEGFVQTVYAQDTSNRSIKEKLAVATMREFGTQHVLSMEKIVFKESSLNPYAINKKSGACGLFQFYPCQKLKCALSDVDCQITAGVKYIKARYGTPAKAWEFHIEHNWY